MQGIVIGYLILSLTLIFRYLAFPPAETPYRPGETVTVRGIIWDEPRSNQYSQRFEINDLTISAPEYPEYQFGHSLIVHGTVEENIFESKNGEEIRELVVKNPDIEVLK